MLCKFGQGEDFRHSVSNLGMDKGEHSEKYVGVRPQSLKPKLRFAKEADQISKKFGRPLCDVVVASGSESRSVG